MLDMAVQIDPICERWNILPPGVCSIQGQDPGFQDKTGAPRPLLPSSETVSSHYVFVHAAECCMLPFSALIYH